MSAFAIVSPRLVQVGGGAVAGLVEVLAKFGLSRPLVVPDPVLVSTGLLRRCTAPLDAAGIAYAVFGDTIPAPADTVHEAGVAVLGQERHD